jgi:hypothetical protein
MSFSGTSPRSAACSRAESFALSLSRLAPCVSFAGDSQSSDDGRSRPSTKSSADACSNRVAK